MSVSRKMVTLVAVSASLGGCIASTTTVGSIVADAAPNSTAGTWQMPWQISPSTVASNQKEGDTVLAYIPQTGFVRATPRTMASIGRPLEPQLGANATVEPCRDVVVSEASKIGARSVEAVSGGAQKRDKQGNYVAPVMIRITYASFGGYEVREATMTCIVSRTGKIVDAFI